MTEAHGVFVKKLILSSLVFFTFTLAGVLNAADEKPLGKNEGPFAQTFLALHDVKIPVPVGEFHKQNDLHYVFVTGLAGDYVPGYYRFQLEQIEKLGVPKRNIHLIRPASARSTESNLPWLKRQLEQIPGKIVVVAHSKGANEMFALSVTQPKFIDDKVLGMYLMQASFFGSPIGDELLMEVQHDLSIFDSRERRMIAFEKIRGKLMYGLFFRQGLRSTSSRHSNELMNRIRAANPAAAVIVQSKIFFITSETDGGLTTRLLNQYGPSDSINPLYTQMVPGWGTHLAHLFADHIGFVLPIGRPVEKRALMSAIYTHVETQGEIEKHCPYIFADTAPLAD